jgi:hypothetical protein
VPPAKSGTRGGARRLLLQLCARRASHCAPCVLLYFYYHPLPEIRRRRRSSFSYASFSTLREWGRSRAPQWRASRMCATHYAFLPTRFSDVIRSSLSFPRPRHLSWHTCVDVNARTEQWIVFFFQQLMTTNYTGSMKQNYKASKYDSINSFTLKHRL